MYSGLGGHGSVVFSYLNEPLLSKYEHHIIFFGVEKTNPEYQKLCEEKNLTYTYVQKRRFPHLGYIRTLFKDISATNPDLMIVHSLPLIPLIMLYRMFSSCKTILIEHASIQLKRGVDMIWTVFGQLTFHRIVYLTSKAHSEAMHRFKIIFDADKNSVISNGIDLTTFAPEENKDTNKEGITLSTHCRLVEVKDLATLVTAFALLKQDLTIKLLIAGEGSVESSLKQLCDELSISEDVIFTGLLDEREIVHFLQKTDIYVNTSKTESMSTSIMQAMGCGLPCVVSDISGNIQMISDQVNGLVFELSNAEDLSKKIKQLIENPQRRVSLGNEARQYASEHFSQEVMKNAYDQLINQTL